MIQLDGTLYIAPDTSLNCSTGYYEQFILAGDTIMIANQRTIVNSNDTGYQGEICYDSNYVYVCISDNVWKRTAISTW